MGRALIVLCKYKFKYKLGEKDGRIEIDDNSQHYAAKAKWVTGSSLFYLILAYSTLIISEFGLVTIIVMTMRTMTATAWTRTTTMTRTITTMTTKITTTKTTTTTSKTKITTTTTL